MLFKDEFDEQNFVQNGFVVKQILQENELNEILKCFYQYHSENISGLNPMLRFGDPSTNIEIHNKLSSLLELPLSKFFSSFKYNANHFIIKGANDDNVFKLHQDWNVVDENKYIAAHCWIALEKISKANGGLFAIPGSHNWSNTIRSGSFGIRFLELTSEIKQQIISFELMPGEAVIYHQALFHGSFPNLTSISRKVCLASVRPSHAEMIYYHKDDDNTTAYEISTEYLFSNILELEKGVPLKNINGMIPKQIES